MRNVILASLLVASAALGSTAANADAMLASGGTATFNGGNGGLGAGETLFASFSPGSTGGVDPSMIYTGSVPGVAADPSVGGMGDPFLALTAGQSATFNFAGGLTELGLDYGSADAYNFFTLMFSDGTSQTLNGQNIIDFGTADGDQSAPRTNGRLTFFSGAGPLISGLTLNSSSNSLEVDNIGVISAVPEPGTWAMMLLGFGGVGFAMRRRQRSPLSQMA